MIAGIAKWKLPETVARGVLLTLVFVLVLVIAYSECPILDIIIFSKRPDGMVCAQIRLGG